MSWDYDPFRGVEIIIPEPGKPQLHCHNCGMDKDLPGGMAMTITQIMEVWTGHLTTSHRITPKDTTGWTMP